MARVYILKSKKTGKFYIGCGEDSAARLADHERGQTQSTRNRGPWELAYEEEHPTFSDARRRERQLKSWKSHRSIQELINGKNG